MHRRANKITLVHLFIISTIVASSILLSGNVLVGANMAALRSGAIAVVFSFAAALIMLSLLMQLLRSISFTLYVIYRIILG